MPQPPRQAMTYSQLVRELAARDAAITKRAVMVERLKSDPADPEVQRYGEANAQALRRTKSGRIMASVAEALAPVLGEMERRLRQLEAREQSSGGVRWAGTWQPGKSFAEGELVTDGGALWLARRSVQIGERPGKGDAFVLIVKRGEARP